MNNILGDIQDEILGKGSNNEKMHIRLQQRNGKKCFTLWEVTRKDLDLKSIISDMKKKFACGGNIKNENNVCIVSLSGDQRQNIVDFMVNNKKSSSSDYIINGY
jgi:translation initiation factor 1